jgi:hypothetical protein
MVVGKKVLLPLSPRSRVEMGKVVLTNVKGPLADALGRKLALANMDPHRLGSDASEPGNLFNTVDFFEVHGLKSRFTLYDVSV